MRELVGFSHLEPQRVVKSARYQRTRTISRHWYKSASTARYNLSTSRPPFSALPLTLLDPEVSNITMFLGALKRTASTRELQGSPLAKSAAK